MKKTNRLTIKILSWVLIISCTYLLIAVIALTMKKEPFRPLPTTPIAHTIQGVT